MSDFSHSAGPDSGVLAAILDASAACLIVTDLRGRILLASRLAVAFFGEDPKLIGRPIAALAADTHRAQLESLLEMTATGTTADAAVASVAIAGDGVPVEIALSASPVNDGDGVSGVLFVIEDLTSRRMVEHEQRVTRERWQAAEDEVRRQRAQLAHAARVSSLGELSASLAHELRQPMAAILSNAQAAQRLLRKPEPDLVEIRTIIDDIVREDRRAGDVISRVRSQIRRGEPKLEALSCADLVQEVVDILARELRSREVTVSVSSEPDLPQVWGDRIQLQQILINLMVNAADAMRGHPPGDRQIAVKVGRRDQAIAVRVLDRGDGIPADQLAQIFTPFFTTKGDGLGMGLGISRTIAEEHGGRLWAENHADGAVFHLVLPIR
jgi:two-component system sensor kinase FixL